MDRSALLVVASLLLFPQVVPAQQPATLQILVPSSNAKVEVEGVPTRQEGPVRRYISPPLNADSTYTYTIKVTWIESGRIRNLTRTTEVRPGQETVLDLRREQGDDSTVRVIYVPTPQAVVDKMLELAGVTKDDVVYDLGCGDGRIVVTAAKNFGAHGVGIDLDPDRIRDSKRNVQDAKVEDLVEIRQGDALKVEDIGKATVVTLYMLPEFNRRLRPILEKELKPGTRIVSHDYGLGDWAPERTVRVQGPTREHLIYLWKVGPAKTD